MSKVNIQPKTVAFHTLGCKLNFAETSTIARQLTDAGYQKVNFDEPAQVYIINTCSVTENADKECRQLVRRIQRKADRAEIVDQRVVPVEQDRLRLRQLHAPTPKTELPRPARPYAPSTPRAAWWRPPPACRWRRACRRSA